jgi:hypothetical protein
MIILRHASLGKTPLDEWSPRRRSLCRTTHNTQNRQTSLPSAVFEPTVPASDRLQTHALDRKVTGIECCFSSYQFFGTFRLIVFSLPAHWIWRYMTHECEILVLLHNQTLNPKTLQCETCSGPSCGLLERSFDHDPKYAASINERLLDQRNACYVQTTTLLLELTFTYLYSTETLVQPLTDLFWPRSDIAYFYSVVLEMLFHALPIEICIRRTLPHRGEAEGGCLVLYLRLMGSYTRVLP